MIRNTDSIHWLPTRHLTIACEVAREDPALLRSLFGVTSTEAQILLARLPADAVPVVTSHAGLILSPVAPADVEHALAETAAERAGDTSIYGRWQQAIIDYQHDLLVVLARSFREEPEVCAGVVGLPPFLLEKLARAPAHQMRSLASWPLFLRLLITPAFVTLLRACGDSATLSTPISLAALGLCALGQSVERRAVVK